LEQRPLWLALALDGVFVMGFVPPFNFVALYLTMEVVFLGGNGVFLIFDALAVGVTVLSFGMLIDGVLRRGTMSGQTKEYLVKMSALILFGTFFAISIGLGMLDIARTGCGGLPDSDQWECYLAPSYPYVGRVLLLTPIVPIATIVRVLARFLASSIVKHRRTEPQVLTVIDHLD